MMPQLFWRFVQKGCAEYTRKQLDELTEWVKRPQLGATGLVYARYNTDGTIKSSVDKFYSTDDLKEWMEACNAAPGDLVLILAGEEARTRKAMSELRLEMGNRLGLPEQRWIPCALGTWFPVAWMEWRK